MLSGRNKKSDQYSDKIKQNSSVNRHSFHYKHHIEKRDNNLGDFDGFGEISYEVSHLENRANLVKMVETEDYDAFKAYWYEHSRVSFSKRPEKFLEIDEMIEGLGSKLTFGEFLTKATAKFYIEEYDPAKQEFDELGLPMSISAKGEPMQHFVSGVATRRKSIVMDLYHLLHDLEKTCELPAYGM